MAPAGSHPRFYLGMIVPGARVNVVGAGGRALVMHRYATALRLHYNRMRRQCHRNADGCTAILYRLVFTQFFFAPLLLGDVIVHFEKFKRTLHHPINRALKRPLNLVQLSEGRPVRTNSLARCVIDRREEVSFARRRT